MPPPSLHRPFTINLHLSFTLASRAAHAGRCEPPPTENGHRFFSNGHRFEEIADRFLSNQLHFRTVLVAFARRPCVKDV